MATSFMIGFADELIKLAEGVLDPYTNTGTAQPKRDAVLDPYSSGGARRGPPVGGARPAAAASISAIPVQRIPAGASPPPQQPVRPPTPTAPAYQPSQPQPSSTPTKRSGGAQASGGAGWSQMADRAPTESTSALVHRQYGVPERQMGVNRGRVYPDANDPKTPQRMRTLWASTPVSEAYAPAIRQPEVKDTSKLNVPDYLQRALGGINHKPQPYLMPMGGKAAPASQPPRPTSISTTTQPAQAAR